MATAVLRAPQAKLSADLVASARLGGGSAETGEIRTHPRGPTAGQAATFARLVAEMKERRDAICELILERVGQRSPGWEAESTFSREQVIDFIESSLDSQLHALAREAMPARAPRVDAAAARIVSRVGELSPLLNGYRVAQAALWETWFALVEDSALEGTERRELLSRGSDFFFRYADLLNDYLSAIYQEERNALRGDRGQRLFAAVKLLLEGEQPASPNALGIVLNQYHLGLIGWGKGCEAAARSLAKDLGRPLLLVAPLDEICWGWISGSRPITESLDPWEPIGVPAGVHLTFGDEEYGEHGFRRTHRQAQRARLLADEARPVTCYSDIAIEALAIEDSEEARRFVARELGAIDDESRTSRRLRETLAAYFAAEHNAASAAATLGVHHQTVSNRLRAAEERLGRSIGARRVELEMALRLRRNLVTEAA